MDDFDDIAFTWILLGGGVIGVLVIALAFYLMGYL